MPTLKQQRGRPVSGHEKAQDMARDTTVDFGLFGEEDDTDHYDTEEQNDTGQTQDD